MIKKTLLAIALLFVLCNVINAQIQVQDTANITATRWRDTCFGLLNLSTAQIPSGYLLDYSMAAFSDSLYNSNVYAGVDTLKESGAFFSLHNIFALSAVNAAATSIGSTDSLYVIAHRYQRDSGYIPLLFLYQQYQKINSSALHQGLFTLTPDSVRLKDVTGRTSSPYNTNTFFAFTPYLSVINQFGNINFALPAQFWLMHGITSVQVDFGDGNGFRTLSQGSKLSIYYNTTGTYYLTAKITVGASTFTAKSAVQYTRPPVYTASDTTFQISVAPVYTSISNYLDTLTGNGAISPGGVITNGVPGPGGIICNTD